MSAQPVRRSIVEIDPETRFADPLGSVRSAMARLRGVLPRGCDPRDEQRRELVDLAVADVIRALVLSRRWTRDLIADFSDLNHEGSELIVRAARVLAVSDLATEDL